EILCGIDVDGLVFVDAAGLDVLNFHYAVVRDGILEAEVDLLGIWIAECGIHEPSRGTGCQIEACRRDDWRGIHAVTVVANWNVSAGDVVAGTARGFGASPVNGVGVGEYLVVRLL